MDGKRRAKRRVRPPPDVGRGLGFDQRLWQKSLRRVDPQLSPRPQLREGGVGTQPIAAQFISSDTREWPSAWAALESLRMVQPAVGSAPDSWENLMAIDREVLDRVRHSVCAIGYLSTPATRIQAEPTVGGLEIAGTGFLAAENLVLTNRHVMEGLIRAARKRGFNLVDRLALEFVVSDGQRVGRLLSKPVRYAIHTEHELDLAILEINVADSPEQAQFLQVAQFGDPSSLAVGQDVSVLGYSHGSTPLTRQGSTERYRYGPLLQQGAVSALAPYDRVSPPEQILLDISVAGGASGSPVFLTESGEVVGIVHSGEPPVYTLALPLYPEFVTGRLDAFRREAEQQDSG